MQHDGVLATLGHGDAVEEERGVPFEVDQAVERENGVRGRRKNGQSRKGRSGARAGAETVHVGLRGKGSKACELIPLYEEVEAAALAPPAGPVARFPFEASKRQCGRVPREAKVDPPV